MPETAASTDLARPTSDTDPLEALARKAAEVAELTAEIEADESQPGTDLVHVRQLTPAELRSKLVARRADLEVAKREMAELQQAAKTQIESMRREMEQRVSEAMEVMRPMQRQLAKMADGIEAFDLYLGRDEELETLRSGIPAPADVPLTVRQLVLSMDQECAVDSESGGIDHMDIGKFTEWLLADERHLDQVLPERKAVVGLMPRITGKDYGNPWENEAHKQANVHTFWLIRNGENLYLTTTPFAVGTRLVPLRDEFISMFRAKRYDFASRQDVWDDIQPGTRQWGEAEYAAGTKQRHFMKVALTLQGLVDRTAVFHPLPAGDVSFLRTESYDAGHVQIIADAENMLTLTTGRKPFQQWLADLNAKLTVGMRIVGAFSGEDWRSADAGIGWDSKREYGRHSRLTPPTASSPADFVIHTIDGTKGGSLTFRYERSDTKSEKYFEADPGRPGWGWDRHRDVPYKTRATCTIKPGDRFIIPIDLVTAAEIRIYLNARTERHEYVTLFPLLKAALNVIEKETAQEAPFRALLAHTLDVDEVEIDVLVRWWKHNNKHHRPLVGDPALEAKACRMIITEYRRRAKIAAAPAGFDPMVLAAGLDGEVLMVARKSDGTWLVACSEDDGNVFIAEHTFTAAGKPKQTKRWSTSGPRLTGLVPTFTSERWAKWDHHADRRTHLSPDEIEATLPDVMRSAIDAYGGDKMLLSVSYVETSKRRFFTVETVQADFAFDPEHPFTVGKTGEAKATEFSLDFVRKPPGVVEIVRYPSHHSRRDDAKVTELFHDPAAETALAEAKARYAERQTAYRRCSTAADDWERSLVASWEAVKVEEAFQRFMVDYGNRSDLWEGHRKTITLPVMPSPNIPFGSRRYGNESWIEFVGAVLVEQGHQVSSLTVRQAVALYEASGFVLVDEWKRTHLLPEFDGQVLDLVPPVLEVSRTTSDS